MKALILFSLVSLTAACGWAQSATDTLNIINTARDYVEGWAEGNTDRVAGAVSPELAKRKVYMDADGNWFVSDMSASLLVQATRGNKEGVRMPDKDPDHPFELEVEILDITGNVASVKAWNIKYGFLDYCHLVKIVDEWTIINVLWEYLPDEN